MSLVAHQVAPAPTQGGRTYNLILTSANRVSGTANAANFDINPTGWLPSKYGEWSVSFTFAGDAAANYLAKTWVINIFYGSRQFSNSVATSGMGRTSGFVRVVDGIGMGAAPQDNSPLCIGRPNSSIRVEIRDLSGDLVLRTSDALDVNPWSMILHFTPVSSSIDENKRYQDA
jgi:hypothetical protein